MKLFEIADELLRAYETVVESDGEVSEENAVAMATLEAIQADKVSSYFWIIQKANSEAEAARLQENRFKAKRAARETLVAFLKERLLQYMDATKQPRIECEAGTLAVQKNSVRPLVLADGITAETIPEDYCRVTKEIDKAKLIGDIKSGKEFKYCKDGEEVTWAKLGEPGSHLRLR